MSMITRVLSRSPLTTVGSFTHGDGEHRDPDEEVFERPTIIFTTGGTWRFSGRHGAVDADPEVVVLGHAGESYRCRHPSLRPTDRTVFVTLDHELLGYDPLPARAAAQRSTATDALLAALTRSADPLEGDSLALRLALEVRSGSSWRLRTQRASVSAAREILDGSVANGITLLELSRAVHVSPYHLSRLFRDEVGCAPHEYLIRLRVRRAINALADGASVSEAASVAGFASPSYFSRVFRRRVGVPPSVYRRTRTDSAGSTTA